MQPGTRLGTYEIRGPLGAGGMGEVYRARDTKLDRDVAIKVLPEDFSSDAERLARFQREAKLLASLNHANIAAIYGLDDDEGKRFIVMELVEGETLAERMAAGSIPLDEVLAIARQIAAALEAAHASGVIHRDLKPANIMVTPAGGVKVLDFGLAKGTRPDGSASSISPEISNSPTMMDATRSGIIIGTAAYMSPEQAAGAAVDQRTDIWAFGVLLYEMLSGGRLFEGESAAHVLADVIKTEADLTKLAPDTPRTIGRLVRRCLHKKVDQRLHHIADARLVIDEVMAGTGDDGLPELVGNPAGEGTGRSTGLPVAHVGLVALFALLVGVMAGWWTGARPGLPSEPVRVFDIATDLAGISSIALSPDGATLAFSGRAEAEGNTQLYLRRMGDAALIPFRDTEDAGPPFFSPDGNWIGFFERDIRESSVRLRKVSLDGASLDVHSFDGRAFGGSWPDQETIVFLSAAKLWRVSSSGGEPSVLLGGDGDQERPVPGLLRGAQLLPDGRMLLQVERRDDGGFRNDLVVYSPDEGTMEMLVADATTPRLVSPGYLFYGRGGSVWVAEYDPDEPTTIGAPELVVQGVRARTGSTSYDVAADGTFAYLPGSFRQSRFSTIESELVAIDRQGTEERLPVGVRDSRSVRFSPDGDRIAVARDVDDGGEIWVYDATTGAEQRLSAVRQRNTRPVWSADGEWIYFNASDPGSDTEIHRARPGFPGQTPEVLGRGTLLDVSPAGDVLFTEIAGVDLGLLPVDGGGATETLLETENEVLSARFSPDGKFLAYSSSEGGVLGVYVRDLETGATTPVSPQGGGAPMWSRDGATLAYTAGTFNIIKNGETSYFLQFDEDGTFMRLTVGVVDGRFRASTPEPFLEEGVAESAMGDLVSTLWGFADLDAAGRLVYGKRLGEALEDLPDPTSVTVTLNWLGQYERRRAAGGSR